jgi:tetratricopeptide (TPR) repeat protein
VEPHLPQVIEPERLALDVVRKHLERIEFSDTLNGLEHQRRLIRLLVEQRIAGRQEPLKQSEIVFARLLASSSTRLKPELLFPDEQAVRTHISRLRKNLLAYYKYEDPSAVFQIEIPKGKYVAIFARRSSAKTAERPRIGPTSKPESPELLNRTAVGLYRQGQYQDAEPILQRVLKMREESLGPEHPDTATSINNLAMLYEKLGRHKEALPLLERALTVCERSLGAEHPDTLIGINNLAIGLMSLGRYKEAAEMFERALALREQTLGAEHPDTATSLNNLATIYEKQGRFKDAQPRLERALAIRERVLGEDHPDTANTLSNLAMIYKAQARFKEAAALSARALDICERVLGTEHPQTVTIRSNHAEFVQL